MVIFILLQYEVVQFDYVCVLFVESVGAWRDIRHPDAHHVSKLVRRPINTDDEVSTVQVMFATGHAQLNRRNLGIVGVAGLVIHYLIIQMLTEEYKK